MKRLDLVGKKFGRLLVVDFSHIDKKSGSRWKCLCKCGKFKVVRGYCLTSGDLKSCGCFLREIASKKAFVHGMYGTRFYKIYIGIQTRCTNETIPEFKYYGAKGIRCEWKDFLAFKKDMYPSYLIHCKKLGIKNTTIERVDFRKNYSKANCRWATMKEQSNNRSNNRIFSYKNITLNLAQWAKKLKLRRTLLYGRLERGWSFEESINVPVNRNYHKI